MIQAKLLDARSRGPEKPPQGRIRRGPASRLRRSRVSRWIASRNVRRYDWIASSGSVVANDPVNGIDPTGEDTCIKNAEGQTICTPSKENVIVVTAPAPAIENALRSAGNLALELVPGGDLARCTFGSQSCSGLDWTLAVVDVVPGVGKLGKLGKLRKFGRACGCVVAGTLVATPTGLVAIETLEVGDTVLAYDVATGEVVPQPVLDLLRTEPKPTYDVVLRAASGETARFEATDDHPWLNDAKEWRNTNELTAGEWLIAGDGDRFEVLEVGLTGDVEEAYTLTVDELHTYIMGEAGLVVHNSCLKDMRRLSPGQIRELKRKGIDPEDLKSDFKMGGREDLYVDKNGDVFAGAKDGSGEATFTGVNVRDLP